MKGFFVFMILVALFLGAFIFYFVRHPSNTTMVRKGASWVILEQNLSK